MVAVSDAVTCFQGCHPASAVPAAMPVLCQQPVLWELPSGQQALGKEPMGVCKGPCHALECPLQDPVPGALQDSPKVILQIHPNPCPLVCPGYLYLAPCLTSSCRSHQRHSPLNGLCLLPSMSAIPHPGGRQAHPCSAQGHCRGSHPPPAGGDTSCQLSCLPSACSPWVRAG